MNLESYLKKKFNDLRLDSTGCDAIIKIGDKTFVGHRAVLMAKMKDFHLLSTLEMNQTNGWTISTVYTQQLIL